MTRSLTHRIAGGICGGLAAASPLNAWTWRALFLIVSLLTSGAGVLVYLLLWWTLPAESLTGQHSRPPALPSRLALLGAVLILGAYGLRDQLVTASGASLYWPLVTLLLALVLFIKLTMRRAHRRHPLLGLLGLMLALGWLLMRAGVLPEGVQDLMLRLWPAAALIAGLSFLLRDRSRYGELVAVLLGLVLTVVVVAVGYGMRVNQQRTDNVFEQEQDLGTDISQLQISVETLGTNVEFTSSTSTSLQVAFTGSEASVMLADYGEDADGLATYTLRETRPSGLPRLDDMGRGTLLMELPRHVAVSITFTGADGDAAFNLAGLDLQGLDLALMRGDALVSLPDYQPRSGRTTRQSGNLSVQSGDLVLVVPESVGGRFVLRRDRDRRPEFDGSAYILIDDGGDGTLEARGYDAEAAQVEYNVAVPAGAIRLLVE